MSPTLKNILIVVVAIIIGSILVMCIEYVSPIIFPFPEGMDAGNMESLKENIGKLSTGNFIIALLAHAVGALISGWFIAKFAVSGINGLVLTTGIIWTVFGVINLVLIPHPTWFMISDICIYIPFTKLVLCPDKDLNYNGSYFFKDQGKKHRHSIAMASIFNADIWKKNNISLNFLFGQST
ncbi:MAG: hypothetical protein H7X99_04305 [Saprospiraceae bacterium]|nr:hypothetical protein [Saprospiraceae bacterium]